MKLLVSLIEEEYPADNAGKEEALSADVWNFDAEKMFRELALLLGNGSIVEMRVDADSMESLEMTRLLLTKVGGCVPVNVDTESVDRLWLYKSGYEAYRQGKNGFIFLNPFPHPELFGFVPRPPSE